ncbi:MAG: hypothetical protein RLY86_1104 [Pseudomonadota bacterium]|jgi:NADPH-dependent curcumin reductase CurA
MGTATVNRRLLVDSYPADLPEPGHFRMETGPIPDPAAGEALVETVWLSMDPFPRMQLTDRPGGPPPIPRGSVMIGRGVARVVASRRDDLAPGQWIVCDPGWQDYALIPAGAPCPRVLDPAAAPPSAALGLLGPSGLTAYLTVLGTGRARPGETVLVTAAAGSVGSAACMIARTAGCRVVAIAGGPDQIAFLTDRVGVDAAIDYLSTPDLGAAIRAAAPDGVHVVLDTVGGATHDAAMTAIAVGARIVLAGFISAYGGERRLYGNPYAVVMKRATMTGFLVGDHAAAFPEALAALTTWYREGRISLFETVTEGLENAPGAFAGLFRNPPPGKQLVRVRD